MQIRTRLTFQFTIIVAFILLASFIAIYYFSAQYRESSFYSRLRDKANTTAELLLNVKEVDSTLLKIIDKNKKDLLFKENIAVYDYEGHRIYSSNDSVDFSNPQIFDGIRKNSEMRWKNGDLELLGFKYLSAPKRFIVIAAATDRFGLSKLYYLENLLFISFFIILGVVGFTGWIYAGRSLRPISQIVTQVQNISAENLSARLDEGNRRDEIARLSATFNELLNRIEATFSVQKTFVANVSHELKNPLTIITSQLEVALLRDRTQEEYRKTLASVLDDIRQLNEVALRLLELARLGNSEQAMNFKPLRIDELLWQCREEIVEKHPGYRVVLSFDLPEDERRLLVSGNEHLLKTAFKNLMDNACKFSSDKEATVSLSTTGDEIRVAFRDNGIGISSQDLPNIFQPFYRGSNTVSISGHGIGLSLVERIITLHRSRIGVTSKPGKGSTFSVVIPVSA